MMVLGFQLNKQENKQETSKKWRGRTDEGAKWPITRRSRLLTARCARCDVTKHRTGRTVRTGAKYRSWGSDWSHHRHHLHHRP